MILFSPNVADVLPPRSKIQKGKYLANVMVTCTLCCEVNGKKVTTQLAKSTQRTAAVKDTFVQIGTSSYPGFGGECVQYSWFLSVTKCLFMLSYG